MVDELEPKAKFAVEAHMRRWLKRTLILCITLLGAIGAVVGWGVSQMAESMANKKFDKRVDAHEVRMTEIEDHTKATQKEADKLITELKIQIRLTEQDRKRLGAMISDLKDHALEVENTARDISIKFSKLDSEAEEFNALLVDYKSQKDELVKNIVERLSADERLREQLKNLPLGSVIAFPGVSEEMPLGWKLCNGGLLPQKGNEQLYKILGKGKIYGEDEDGSFHLPNYRGLFLRGVDEGKMQRDHQDRRFSHNNRVRTTTIPIGSYQEHAFNQHDHSGSETIKAGDHFHSFMIGIRDDEGPVANHGHGRRTPSSTGSSGAHKHDVTIKAEGGPETRPENVYVYWIIKVS